MILNSNHIFCLASELKDRLPGLKIAGAAISPDLRDILLHLRGKGERLGLFFSSHSENCRIEIWESSEIESRGKKFTKTNLFSHAGGGHIQKLEQMDFDRMICVSCDKRTQFGSGERFDLVFELTGRNGNLILLKPDGTIIDCLRKVDSTQSRSRRILPGEKYLPPPAPKKKNPLTVEKSEFCRSLESEEVTVNHFLVRTFLGMDQLSARAIIVRSGLDQNRSGSELNPDEAGRLWEAFRQYFDDVSNGRLTFQLVLDEGGAPLAISCVDLPFVPDEQKVKYESMSSAIGAFFSERIEKEQSNTEINRLSRIVRRALKSLGERQSKIRQDLNQAERFEQYKRFGDLLMMNKAGVKKGQTSVTFTDVFDPSQPSVEIPLDPKLGATANAQRYFKKHRKAKDALGTIQKRKAETKHKMENLQKLAARLENPGEETNPETIEQSLISLGLVKQSRSPVSRRGEKKPTFRTFLTGTGWEIIVGRNNRENDILSFKVARPDDLWFHAQDLPGSHVVLRRKDKKAEPSSGEIRQAAEIAAYFSKARQEKKAEVAYTLAKYVRKPKRAKPGLALVENEKSITVRPGLPQKIEDTNRT